MELGVDAPLVGVLHDCIDECAVSFVKLTQLHNHLSDRVLVHGQELLGERRRPSICGCILQVHRFEDLGNTGRGPRFYGHARQALDLRT
jgi:hypothetical protein